MVKKYTLIFAMGFLFCFSISAQNMKISPSVIASNGATATAGNTHLSWTIGELSVSCIDNGDTYLSQGFQQPFEADISVSILESNLPEGFELSVFPNPTLGEVNLIFENPFLHTIYVFDVKSNLLKELNSSALKDEIDLSTFPEGKYLIHVKDDSNNRMTTVKVLIQK